MLNSDDLRLPCAEDGTRLALEIEPLAAAEIDITHTFAPPERSGYHRTLVRGRRKDAPPRLGWVESNRFVGRS